MQGSQMSRAFHLFNMNLRKKYFWKTFIFKWYQNCPLDEAQEEKNSYCSSDNIFKKGNPASAQIS
jgi:hypothetical protein